MVPVAEVPPVTLGGAIWSETTSALTVSKAVCCDDPVTAVTVTVLSAAGLTVVTVKVPVV